MRISIPISTFVIAFIGCGNTLAFIAAAAHVIGVTQIQIASWVNRDLPGYSLRDG